MINRVSIFVILLLLSWQNNAMRGANKIDLSGSWSVKLDSTDVGIKSEWQGKIFSQHMTLPGTTDAAQLGEKNQLKPALAKPQLLHLTRAYSYIGPAWYSKKIEIPTSWNGKDISLKLERVIWDSQVWVDNEKVPAIEESLTTPHVFDLTQYLTPGKHIITIRINNSKRHENSVKELAHSYTNDTQVKWNGVLGEFCLEAFDKVRISNVQLYPNCKDKTVKAVVSLLNNTAKAQKANLELCVNDKNGVEIGNSLNKKVSVKAGESTIEVVCPLGDKAEEWNEFNPVVYTANVKLANKKLSSECSENFGLRELTQKDKQFILNGNPIFLRGTLECCIFPLTGTPPLTKDGWYKVFNAAKSYGLNHLRFHSWCPPKAAFDVADELGFYIQVELPNWTLNIGEDKGALKFFSEEGQRIIANYGNHPSFCFWSMGNELEGDFNFLHDLMVSLKNEDNRHLYTTTTFTFMKGHGVGEEPDDDFVISQWTKKGWMRGQGVFNKQSPNFSKDFTKALSDCSVPFVTHEVGQYSVYPDLTEIEKYKNGTLIPLNFMAVRDDLIKKGMIDKAPQFLNVSGKLAAILYKEEIERALKTKGISGFQLLDLHDFPGQGTALVGLLNAFWESKGVITSDKFKEFCSPIVPLLRFGKATYLNNETFTAEIDLCNYSSSELVGKTMHWSIKNGDVVVKQGVIPVEKIVFGYNGKLGTISVPLSGVNTPAKLEVELSLEGTEAVNHWNLWCYPASSELKWGKVKYTENYTDAVAMLKRGETVLFNPDWNKVDGIVGSFVPVFWSPVHFDKEKGGTMGILCNDKHNALKSFPTDANTDWQWWDLLVNSTNLMTDSIDGGNSIVEVVDNFVSNHKLANLVEGKVGKGKLMLATFDLKNDLEKRIVAKQMLVSLLEYMNSEDFTPVPINNFDKIDYMFNKESDKK